MRKAHLMISLIIGLFAVMMFTSLASAQPDSFNLVSPDNGENLSDNKPIFEWESSSIDNYQLIIDDNPDFSSPVYDNSELDTTSHEIENALIEDGVYWWKVIAHEGSENTESNQDWMFRFDEVPPSAPELDFPADGENISENQPTLSWGTVEENSLPVEYKVVVSDNSDFPYENDSSVWITDNNYTLSPGLSEGTWYWKVRARDDAGNESAYSSVWAFGVDLTPPTIYGIMESDISSDSITIEWTTSEPAESFVEYGENRDYGDNQSDDNLVINHSVTLTGLSENTTYHYRVKSIDEAGNATVSTDLRFEIPVFLDPYSSVDNITSYWQSSKSITITATARDNDGWVDEVSLYYRYRENSSASWGSWTNFGTETSEPWKWNFDRPENGGLYEFYTLATDGDGQVEEAPSEADEKVGFDNDIPSLTLVQLNEENTVTTSIEIEVSVSASDETSGLDKIRFSEDNQNWTEWESYASEKDFELSLPEGNKTVYVQVKDKSGLTSSILENTILLENATFTKNISLISEDSNKLANFKNWNIPINVVRVYAKEDIFGAKIDVRFEETKPTAITKKEPGDATAYYFEIETNVPTENISELVIEFDLEKSWLTNHEFEENYVKLQKLNGDWSEVPMVIIGENNTHINFSTTVSDFSWFALTGERPSPGLGPISIIIIAVIAVLIIALIGWWWTQLRGGMPTRKSRSGGI